MDDLEATGASDFTLLWHPGEAAAADGRDRYRVATGHAVLSMSLVLPDAARHATAQRSMTTHERKTASLGEIAVTVPGPTAQCGALFAWGGTTPPQATLVRDAGTWTLEAPGRTIRLRPRDRRVATA